MQIHYQTGWAKIFETEYGTILMTTESGMDDQDSDCDLDYVKIEMRNPYYGAIYSKYYEPNGRDFFEWANELMTQENAEKIAEKHHDLILDKIPHGGVA